MILLSAKQLLRRSVAVAWLALVWVMLWGTWNVANVVAGVVLGFLLIRFFPLPDVRFRTQPSVLGIAVWVSTVIAELIVASVQVGFQALCLRTDRKSAIVAVQLESRSELVQALLIESVTLVPGSMVLEFERAERVIYAHIWGASSSDDVEAARAHILKLEQRVVRAVGDRRGDE